MLLPKLIPAAVSAAALLFISDSAHSARIIDQDDVAFDLYGSVTSYFGNDDASAEISGNGSRDKNTVYPEAELGVAARSAISDKVYAVMNALWRTEDRDGNAGSLSDSVYLYAGIDAGPYGILLAGNGDNAFYTVAGATDIFDALDLNAGNYYFLGDQRPGMLMYSLSALSWDLRLSWQFAEDNLGYTPLYVKNGYAAAVSTKFGDNVSFAYGFDYHKFTYGGGKNAAETREFFAPLVAVDRNISLSEAEDYQRSAEIGSMLNMGFSLSYGVLNSGLYAALSLTATDYSNLHEYMYSAEGVISNTFNNGFTVSAGYGFKSYDSVTAVSDLILALSYRFNANFKIFAQSVFDLGGKADKIYTAEYIDALRLNENKFVIGAKASF